MPTQAPHNGLLALPSAAAVERDLGGTGDCFFRAAAYGLDIQGVRHTQDEQALTTVAHTLRLNVVQSWVHTLKSAQRGDGSRLLAAALIAQAQQG